MRLCRTVEEKGKVRAVGDLVFGEIAAQLYCYCKKTHELSMLANSLGMVDW